MRRFHTPAGRPEGRASPTALNPFAIAECWVRASRRRISRYSKKFYAPR